MISRHRREIRKRPHRLEDERLLRGAGSYSDDFNQPDQLYAGMVRSPHAHAMIKSVNCTRACAMAGVHTVLTGADYCADGLKDIGHVALSLIHI